MRQSNNQGASMNRANRRNISSHGGRNGQQYDYGNEQRRTGNYGQDEYTTNEQDNDYSRSRTYDRYNESGYDRDDDQEFPGTYPDETERITGNQYGQGQYSRDRYNNYSDESNRGYNYDDYDENEDRNSASYGGSLGRNSYRQGSEFSGSDYNGGRQNRSSGQNTNSDYGRNRRQWSDYDGQQQSPYGNQYGGGSNYSRQRSNENRHNNYNGSQYSPYNRSNGSNRNADNSYRGYDDDYNSGRRQSNRVRSYGDYNNGNGNYSTGSDYGRMPYDQDDYRRNRSSRRGFGSQYRGESTQISRNGRNNNTRNNNW